MLHVQSTWYTQIFPLRRKLYLKRDNKGILGLKKLKFIGGFKISKGGEPKGLKMRKVSLKKFGNKIQIFDNFGAIFKSKAN